MSDLITIEKAAIKLADGTVYSLPRPNRHPHVIWHINSELGHKNWRAGQTQGFVTNEEKFVGREEGKKIAVAAEQPFRDHGPNAYKGTDLFSEDLW